MNGSGNSLGPHESPPAYDVDIFDALLMHGRNIRQGREALLGGNCQQPDFARARMLQGKGRIVHGEVDIAAQQVIDRVRARAITDGQGLQAHLLLISAPATSPVGAVIA